MGSQADPILDRSGPRADEESRRPMSGLFKRLTGRRSAGPEGSEPPTAAEHGTGDAPATPPAQPGGHRSLLTDPAAPTRVLREGEQPAADHTSFGRPAPAQPAEGSAPVGEPAPAQGAGAAPVGEPAPAHGAGAAPVGDPAPAQGPGAAPVGEPAPAHDAGAAPVGDRAAGQGAGPAPVDGSAPAHVSFPHPGPRACPGARGTRLRPGPQPGRSGPVRRGPARRAGGPA